MTLHIIQKSPFSSSALDDCLKTIGPDDSILLMNDGVYACKHPILNDLSNCIFALKEDLMARGLAPINNIQSLEYSGFVAECCNHQNTISWF